MRSPALHARLFAVFALVALAACSSATPTSGFPDDPANGGFVGGDDKTGGGFDNTGGTKPSTTNQAGCSEAAKLVYVVSDSNELYSFAPDKLAFTKIGTLRCPSSGATPNSMAIDRSGTAWVNFSDGALFKVSTANAECEATKFARGQSGFNRFGMAFATNSAGSQDETLYVVGIEDNDIGKGLAKIDLSTMKLTRLGDFPG